MSVGEIIKERSRDLARKISRQNREHLGEELTKKEKELKEFENALNQREEEVSQRERKINRYYLIPRIYVQVPSIILICAIAYFTYAELRQNHSDISSQANPNVEKSLLDINKEKEAEIYEIFNDIDPNNLNFYVGNYCLNRENRGIVSFEECLAIVASKLTNK